MDNRRRAALGGLALALPLLVLLATRAIAPSTLAGAAALATATPTTAPLPTPTASSAVLDQEQPVFTGGLSVRRSSSQTVTVGRAGALVRVDLPLCAPIKNSNAVLTVSSTSVNAPSVAVTFIFAHSYSDCAWYTFNFAHPISANVGDVLTLTLTTSQHNAPLWGEDGHPGNPYPRGVGNWIGHTVNFAFKTYMQ